MLRLTQAVIRMSTGSSRASRGARRNNTRNINVSVLRAGPTAAVALKPLPVEPAVVVSNSQENRQHFSDKKFSDAPISIESKSAIKHEYLSDVQAATLDLGLAGKDLLVQAKTGTGKTMAFLLPTVERLAKSTSSKNGNISVLILSPTRELALQIEEEAKALLVNHPLAVQHAIGGTNTQVEAKGLLLKRCDILIATPGRLIDHLETGNLKPKLQQVQNLILDEADRLLEQGFARELDKILSHLPDKKQVPRQTMLFSATMSQEVKKVVEKALNPDHQFVSTLSEYEANTHQHVPQTVITAPLSTSLAATLQVLRDDLTEHGPSSKVMVFFPTARATSLAADVCRNIPGLPQILEIHSRMSQPRRIRAADTFKDAQSAILFSSDVAARGMDFPGVTLVVQTGLPSSAEQYIHRLGRTARAGRSGRGILILAPFESFFLSSKEVKTLPISSQTLSAETLPSQEITDALMLVDNQTKAQAYGAWLGYYKQFLGKMGVKPQQFVEMANIYAMEILGYPGTLPPPMEARTVGKMGLKGVKGLNIVKQKR